MITPLDFERNTKQPGQEWGEREGKHPLQSRGDTLSEFLFPEDKDSLAIARANLPSIWTDARLSATFSFVSPAVRAQVKGDVSKSLDNTAWTLHLVDGGYTDNYGVASALDWRRPVLEARLKDEKGLNFSRVLIINLRGWAEPEPKDTKSSNGFEAALLGPLDAVFAIRDGVAKSRDAIDLEGFLTHWNRECDGKVILESVVFAPSKPNSAQKLRQGPLSWHLIKNDIENMKFSWVDRNRRAGRRIFAKAGARWRGFSRAMS